MDFSKPKKSAAFKVKSLASLIFLSCLPIDVAWAQERSETSPERSGQEHIEFDVDLLIGEKSKKIDLSRFSKKNRAAPGRYIADIWFNDEYFSRQSVSFVAVSDDEVQPCLTEKMLKEAQIRFKQTMTPNADGCLLPGRDLASSQAQFDISTQKLNILIPQILLEKRFKGVPEEQLSSGESALFANYDTNYYYSHSKTNPSHSVYLFLNSGLNLGLWQLRSQSNATGYKSHTQKQQLKWQTLRTYLQRPLTSLGSQLTVGETYTASNGFSGTGFVGVKLETDERMKPDRERGYAPVIRGVAATTAKVTLRQRGQIIHQTTVSPGAFEIDDLPPTSFQGDIDVSVEEADGRVSSFSVPFAAVPDSLRPGYSQFSVVAGETANTHTSNALFTDLVWRKGVSNQFTYNSGLRLSRDYLSLLSGLVYSNPFGAFGFNSIWSSTSINGERLNGWRLGSTWSRTFNTTGTKVALAGYRYSTLGYRELNDVLGLRDAAKDNQRWQSDSYQQSSQLTLTLNQNLNGYGNLWLSGTQSRYHNGGDPNMSFYLGYSNAWKSINYDISVNRQYSGLRKYGLVADTNNSRLKAENIFMLSFSVPLSTSARAPNLSTSINHAPDRQNRTSLRSSVSGTLGNERRSVWSINANRDTQGNASGFGGSLTQNFSAATTSMNFSKSDRFFQGGAALRGSLVMHQGGVTFGPYLGDSFALVEAQGAQGATLINGMGATIDRFGYAIYPTLIPYRYNEIALDAKNTRDAYTELTDNQKRVAAYSGAMVKVKFKTQRGYPVLIKVKDNNKLPLNADVFDENNNIVGLVGQGNQIYARVSNQKGVLSVGDRSLCNIAYSLDNNKSTQLLWRLTAACSH
ncbi:fimbria/pilus outer membrane usher protein [Pantoea osteomyelitidis]|uniref:fimbria/pilus outer membrane usher protein n=1 Tax=Pantoea osteomyelitidis TaxID=3230026 RepID=UPI0037C5177E